MNKLQLKKIILLITPIILIVSIVRISKISFSLKSKSNDAFIIEKIVKYDFKDKVVFYFQNDICGVCIFALLEKINKLKNKYKEKLVFLINEDKHRNMLELHLKNEYYTPLIIKNNILNINYSFVSYYFQKRNKLHLELINLNTNLDFILAKDF